MMNNVAFNELRYRRETEPPEPLRRDRGLLDGFWESYPAMSLRESLLTAQLVRGASGRAPGGQRGQPPDRDRHR